MYKLVIYIGTQHQSEILEIVSEEEKHLRLKKKRLEEYLQIVMLHSKCKAFSFRFVFF